MSFVDILIYDYYSNKEDHLHFLVDHQPVAVHFEFAIIGEILSENGQVSLRSETSIIVIIISDLQQILLAALVLVLVYVLIIFDVSLYTNIESNT